MPFQSGKLRRCPLQSSLWRNQCFVILLVVGAGSARPAAPTEATRQKEEEFRRCRGGGPKTRGETMFQEFLAQVPMDTFFRKYWGRTPMKFDGSKMGRNYTKYLSVYDVESIIDEESNHEHRLKGRPMAYGRHFSLSRTGPGGLAGIREDWSESSGGRKPRPGEPARLLKGELRGMLDAGWSIVANQLYSFWRPLLELATNLEGFLEASLSMNLYVTPGGLQGFGLHFDNVHVFFMQLSGRKRWKVYPPAIAEPMERVNGFFGTKAQQKRFANARGNLLLDTELAPGDVLYIPRGFLHEGVAFGKQGDKFGDAFSRSSAHITFSPEYSSWAEFLSKTPYIKASGQPDLPGATPFQPATREEQKATQGLPLFLRTTIPPRLSQVCGTNSFRRGLLDTLLALDVDRPSAGARKKLKKRLEARLEQMNIQGPPSSEGSGGILANNSDEVLQRPCLQFLFNVVLPELLSLDTGDSDEKEATTGARAGRLGLDTPLCVRSALAARVASGGQRGAKLRYSSLNGPAARANVDKIKPKEVGVPVEFVPVLAAVLHSERNPHGYFTPRDLSPNTELEKRAVKLARKLLKLKVVEMLGPDSTRKVETGAANLNFEL